MVVLDWKDGYCMRAEFFDTRYPERMGKRMLRFRDSQALGQIRFQDNERWGMWGRSRHEFG